MGRKSKKVKDNELMSTKKMEEKTTEQAGEKVLVW